jgi:hypothetical protein
MKPDSVSITPVRSYSHSSPPVVGNAIIGGP